MGSGKRGLLTAALTVVCAVTVLAAPGAAFAAPAPTPAPPSGGSPAPRPGKDLQAIREKLDELYHDAAVATDAYNAAEEKTEKQSAEIVALAQKIDQGRQRLAGLRNQAGAAARDQYRTGGLSSTAQFLLSDDPGQFLDSAGRVLQGQQAATKLMAEMTRTQAQLRQYAADASARWRQLDANREAKAAAKKKIEKQIDAAEKLESRLEKKEKERLAQLEREAADKAQTAWLDTGVLKDVGGKASEQDKKAVKYATEQLGKPYVWGAEGPDSFDCSGLTSQAWASAGHAVPRTSQEQWRQLKHVAVEDMRPGDLIIYFDDASHVAMYIGGGAIIHAPRPGRTVTVAGAGSMPILGVVRPDA
ncbi:glycoside hydrolase [Streptomyces sp. SID486]|uniref:C40 family peptidase n=1 Tax=unclassified Streptomyces TaxID=2593676 RepID=UPI00136BBE11|nr:MULTISPECIES: C40 family peptidase [unclassified Streptomyces]MYW16609.1 glycoside hydrolase [Streptomyces sp. SID2955]MYW42335.1 glycoside hydrolase [Streptomyces sp. SID161]MYX94636.1 glycoside hydrolase [Streptomyces sp. SID486]